MVDVIWPKLELPKLRDGALNWGVFRKLNDSQRNWTLCPSLMRKSLKSAKSQVFCAGASNRPTPALPYPLGPEKIPSPGQPSHLDRTKALVLDQLFGVRPSITRSTRCPGTTFGLGLLPTPVLWESPVWVTVTGRPEVN